MQQRVLFYEADPVLSINCLNALEKNLFRVQKADSENQLLEILNKQNFEIVIFPLTHANEIEKIAQIKKNKIETHIIVISTNANPEFIVDCVRYGASHFWLKEENTDSLINVVQEVAKRISKVSFSKFEHQYSEFIGRHPKMLEVYDLVFKIKENDCNILITGESGTGKEVIARAIHHLSNRKNKPLVAVNCGAIPINLLESELFGHVKGAFTGASQNRVGRFQLAQSGSLFLDEIGDLSFDLQAKLLRAIQHKVYEPVGAAYSLTLDARIIAATNQDLEKLVAEKRFREDLFYRLNVIPIQIPALRHRKSDIPILVNHFLTKFAQNSPIKIHGISEEAMLCLTQYHWPGNIRELENLIERVVILKKESGLIEIKDFPVDYFKNIRLDRFLANVALPEDGVDFNMAVDEFENELILQALQRTSGNKNKAATLLKINRTTLVEKLKRKGLQILAS